MPDDPVDKPDPTQAFQSRLTKMNGDAMAFAAVLFDENFRLREEKRTVETQLSEAKAKVPAGDHVVLKPAEAKDYEVYKALGTPKEVKERLDGHATLEAELKELKQKDVLRDVANLNGYEPEVLFGLDKLKGGFAITFKEEKGNKVAYIAFEDKELPFEDYAKAELAPYMPSLKVETAPQPRAGNGFDPKPKTPTAPTVADIKAKKLSSGHYAGY